jgi:AraC-like DNA-binding protein
MPDIADRQWLQEHDSPLGRWRVAMLRPAPELEDAVEGMWLVDGMTSYDTGRVLPRGNAHLMFNLGAPQYLVDPHGVRAPVEYRRSWISGQQSSPLDVANGGATSIIGVRFLPLGAWRVLGIAQHELAGQVVDLDALLGDAIHALHQRLLEAGSVIERFACFEAWLLHRVRQCGRAHFALRWAVDRLVASRGALPIGQLAAELGYSRKHVAQLFQREVGLTPKAFARVQRFAGALARLREARVVRWDEFALDCGYYDQAHLIREFQACAGHSPASFLRHAALDDEWIVER